MAKAKSSGAAGRIGFKNPKVDRIEIRDNHTTKNPVATGRLNRSPKSEGKSGFQKKSITEAYSKSANGRLLKFGGIPDAVFDKASVGESRERMSGIKRRFMSDYSALNNLARKSTLLEVRPHTTTRKGNVKGSKQNWNHLYHALGTTVFEGKRYKFSFYVSAEKGKKQAHVYSFDIRKER